VDQTVVPLGASTWIPRAVSCSGAARSVMGGGAVGDPDAGLGRRVHHGQVEPVLLPRRVVHHGLERAVPGPEEHAKCVDEEEVGRREVRRDELRRDLSFTDPDEPDDAEQEQDELVMTHR
jgi:hypothetical protein